MRSLIAALAIFVTTTVNGVSQCNTHPNHVTDVITQQIAACNPWSSNLPFFTFEVTPQLNQPLAYTFSNAFLDPTRPGLTFNVLVGLSLSSSFTGTNLGATCPGATWNLVGYSFWNAPLQLLNLPGCRRVELLSVLPPLPVLAGVTFFSQALVTDGTQFASTRPIQATIQP